jgi:hypothetical protein
MVRRRLRLYPYHTLLVIPFIVLFLYAQNLEQARPQMTYRTLLLGLAVTATFFGLFYLYFRDRLRTGVFVSIVLFMLFQYGVVYDTLEELYFSGKWPFRNIHRYLIAAYLLLLSAVALYMKRSKRDFFRLNYFLNFLILLLIGFNLIRLNLHAPLKRDSKGIKAGFSLDFSGTAKPNFYYIVLDGYASDGVLKEHYQFDNHVFTDFLKKNGFGIADSAFANYYFTAQSLAATLNLNYLSKDCPVNDQLRQNAVFSVMKDNGYRIYNLRSGYAVTSNFVKSDSTILIDGPNEFEKSILRYTILRLDDLVGYYAHKRLKSQLEKMHEMANLRISPRFCFMHFVAPHPPYVFDRKGKIRTKHTFAENSWEPPAFYVDQLVYMNRKITVLIQEIVRKDPKAVIVLQSDHGPWITSGGTEEVFNARAGILYAFRSEGLKLPRVTSAVNTFRFLFNQRLNCSLDTLPDKYAGKEELMSDPILLKKARRAVVPESRQ